MAALFEHTPRRALAVYAHPDDADVSCGGTLALWAKAGTETHLAICTRGDKGTSDPTLDAADLSTRREKEVEKASKLLGIRGRHALGYPDGELPDDRALREALVGLIRSIRPDMVLCPDPTAVIFGEEYFNHHDHRVAGMATMDAVSPAAAMPLYFPKKGAAHHVESVLLSGTLEPTVWVDISSTIEDKVRAVSCHESQFDNVTEWAREAVRLRAKEEGSSVGVEYAEGFRRLRLGG